MGIPLRLIVIEDSESDAFLLIRKLEKADYDVTAVVIETADDFVQQLRKPEGWDIVVADYNLPQFNALTALKLLQESNLDIPFIVVSGSVGEETAANVMKAGAHDYLLKGNLTRLCPAVDRELKDASARREHRKALEERKKADDAFRESEERLRLALTATDIVLFDLKLPGGEVRMISDYGVAAGTVLSGRDITLESWYERIHPDDLNAVKTSFQACASGVLNHFELEFRQKTKRTEWGWFFLECRTVDFDSAGRAIRISGIVLDITERKNSEESLRESEEKYKSLFERNPIATFVSTPEGELLDCNPAYLKIFGFSSVDEARQFGLRHLFRRPQALDHLLRALRHQKRIELQEIEMVKANGEPVQILCNLVGKFDEDDRLVEITNYFVDDTERLRLTEELRQAQKLKSLGTLAGGIAHDFNNLLASIMGNVSLMKDMELTREQQQKCLDAILMVSKRGADLVKQLLTFARKGDVNLVSVSLRECVDEVMKLLHETFPKTITIELSLPSEIPNILADSTQIYQVLLNLCVNARDAMPNGGKLTLAIQSVEGETLRPRFGSATDDTYVLVEVSDTGQGMEEEIQRRLFEPFFTTKEIGKGTGLGLAVVFGIVESHHGFIDLSSQKEKGSSFRAYFPSASGNSLEHRSVEVREGLSSKGSEKILFVDDEEILRDVARVVLSEKGYQVLLAADGEEAIKIYREKQEEIALVFSDLGLPKLSGADVLRELKKISATVKFILASGYLEQQEKTEITELGAMAIIQKPYLPDEMATKIRWALDRL